MKIGAFERKLGTDGGSAQCVDGDIVGVRIKKGRAKKCHEPRKEGKGGVECICILIEKDLDKENKYHNSACIALSTKH